MQQLRNIVIKAVADDLTHLRYSPDQLMKLILDTFQIRKDVSVIVFEIIDDQSLRTIVKKLGLSIEI